MACCVVTALVAMAVPVLAADVAVLLAIAVPVLVADVGAAD